MQTMAARTLPESDMSSVDMPDAILDVLTSGGTLGNDCWGTTPDEREALYNMGYALYEQGRYEDAFKVFSLLVIQDHFESRYLFGLGATCQVLGRYTDALKQYMAAAALRSGDPLPIFHAAECLVALSHFNEAKDSLALVLELCTETDSVLLVRAKALLRGLQDESLQTGERK